MGFGIVNHGLTQEPAKYYGKLMSVMRGDLSAKFNLEKLQNEKHVYGLGAVENLKGEITIVDGKPFIASVSDDEINIDKSLNSKAALFVYSVVEKWIAQNSHNKFGSILEIENSISRVLEANGVDDEPLPFLIKGKVKSLSWHIIDWAEGDTIHTHKKHKMSGLHGTIENTDVTIIGFYSKNHHGIITHKNSDIHMHFVAEDQKLSGHVDNISFHSAILYLQE